MSHLVDPGTKGTSTLPGSIFGSMRGGGLPLSCNLERPGQRHHPYCPPVAQWIERPANERDGRVRVPHDTERPLPCGVERPFWCLYQNPTDATRGGFPDAARI